MLLGAHADEEYPAYIREDSITRAQSAFLKTTGATNTYCTCCFITWTHLILGTPGPGPSKHLLRIYICADLGSIALGILAVLMDRMKRHF